MDDHETKFNGTVKLSLPNNIVYNKESNISINTPITKLNNTNITKERKTVRSKEKNLEEAQKHLIDAGITGETLDKFMPIVDEYFTYRAEIKKTFCLSSVKKWVKDLLNMCKGKPELAQKIIDFNIAQGYEGTFAPKDLYKQEQYYEQVKPVKQTFIPDKKAMANLINYDGELTDEQALEVYKLLDLKEEDLPSLEEIWERLGLE